MQAPSIAAELHGFLKMGEPGLVSGFSLPSKQFRCGPIGQRIGKAGVIAGPLSAFPCFRVPQKIGWIFFGFPRP
jgi:hypothetical protein